MHTLDDLEKAKEALRDWEDRSSRYSGNNPDKYASDIKSARRTVRMIEEPLKESGAISLTAQEALEKALDAAFPNA